MPATSLPSRTVRFQLDGASGLAGLLTRRVPLAQGRDAFERRDGDIKVVVLFEPDGA